MASRVSITGQGERGLAGRAHGPRGVKAREGHRAQEAGGEDAPRLRHRRRVREHVRELEGDGGRAHLVEERPELGRAPGPRLLEEDGLSAPDRLAHVAGVVAIPPFDHGEADAGLVEQRRHGCERAETAALSRRPREARIGVIAADEAHVRFRPQELAPGRKMRVRTPHEGDADRLVHAAPSVGENPRPLNALRSTADPTPSPLAGEVDGD